MNIGFFPPLGLDVITELTSPGAVGGIGCPVGELIPRLGGVEALGVIPEVLGFSDIDDAAGLAA